MFRTGLAKPIDLTKTVARIAQELEPMVAVANAQTMQSLVAASMAKRSFTMVLLAIAAGIAIVLSAVGIYGVVSYVVAQRRGEIGVRMALGATIGRVTGMVLAQSMTFAAVGVVVGVAVALATTRLMQTLLYGVSATDWKTLVVVPLGLALVVLAASYGPARRAARIDPVKALRSE